MKPENNRELLISPDCKIPQTDISCLLKRTVDYWIGMYATIRVWLQAVNETARCPGGFSVFELLLQSKKE
jgi:hypothetical protein